MAQPKVTALYMTPEEFLVASLPDGKAELVRGEVRLSPPAGGPHGRVASNLAGLLIVHVKAHQLGWVFTDGVGYELPKLPRTVRVPDLSFVRADRYPPNGLEEGLMKFAPDLIVEVVSPSERAWELQEKLDDYRVSGVPLAWVADPRRRAVTVIPAAAPARTLHIGEVLDGGDVIPGFSCDLAEVFKGCAPLE